jgi:hypothetical protein
MAGVLALHVMNPDAMIARTNVARALEGKPFDVAHVSALSGDAVPVLVQALPELPASSRKVLVTKLGRRWGGGGSHDWRTWSVSRAQALESWTLLHTTTTYRAEISAGIAAGR